MGHAQIVIDPAKEGEEGVTRALRNVPVGGTIKLLGSGLGLTRVGGGRTFHPVVPPKVTDPVGWKLEDFKSATTAGPALLAAHNVVMERNAA